MSLQLVHDHSTLFAPPVELPLKFRALAGLFGVDRHNAARTYQASNGATSSYEPLRSHMGLDLLSTANRPVFAARAGEVVHINQIDGSADNLRFFVRHMAPGPAYYVTRYLHVRKAQVSVGQQVGEGEALGLVGGRGDHLHFEIRMILRPGVSQDWANGNTEPLDPAPFLYRWDKIYHERIKGSNPRFGASRPLNAAAVLRRDGFWFFEVGYGNTWPVVPLLAPDEGDRQLVALLRDAHRHLRPVRLATRTSGMFGSKRLIVGARVMD